MAISNVTLSDDFLSGTATSNFKNSSESTRYKTFAKNNLAESSVVSEDMLKSIMKNISSDTAVMSNDNKKKINSLVVDSIESHLDIGGSNISNRNELLLSLDTICGNFDSGLYSKYGASSDSSPFSLMSLLTALLCMGISNAISIIAGMLGKSGTDLRLMPNVVSETLSGLSMSGTVDSVSNLLNNDSFAPSKVKSVSYKIDSSVLLDDILSSEELSKVFRGSDVSYELINSLPENSEATKYLDTLTPGWTNSRVNTKNSISAISEEKTGTPIMSTDDIFTSVEITREETRMMFS